MPCKRENKTMFGALPSFSCKRFFTFFLGGLLLVPAVVTVAASVKNGVIPTTSEIAIATIPITFLGWFASAFLSRKNTATQAKHNEINKIIEQIESALKDLAEVCSSAMKDSERAPNHAVVTAQINVAKVQRIKNLLDRLHGLDPAQENMNDVIITIRRLVTDESNFLCDAKLAQTFNMIVRLESWVCSRFERRF